MSWYPTGKLSYCIRLSDYRFIKPGAVGTVSLTAFLGIVDTFLSNPALLSGGRLREEGFLSYLPLVNALIIAGCRGWDLHQPVWSMAYPLAVHNNSRFRRIHFDDPFVR